MNTVIICTTCVTQSSQIPEHEALIRALSPLPQGWQLHTHACLSMCGTAVNMAVQAENKATYIFKQLNANDAQDLHRFFKLYEQAPRGWIKDARPLGRLRFCLHARVPASPVPHTP